MSESSQSGDSPASGETVEAGSSPVGPISLGEHDETAYLDLPESDVEFLSSLTVVDGDASPLAVTHDSEGHTRVESGSHVGAVSLPSGLQVEVTPKETTTSLLWLLEYALDTPTAPAETETGFAGAETFHEVMAVLFESEMRAVLQRGLDRSYTDRATVSDRIRGRLDVQRQLRRPTPAPTDFAVEYRELTTATTLNHAVVVAAEELCELAADPVAGRLEYVTREWRSQIDGDVPRTVDLTAVDRIELSRLSNHYTALLSLTRNVLAGAFFEDVRAGDRRARALFVDMNDVFERVVERATRAVVADWSFEITGQATIPALVQGPHGSDTVRPDVVVENRAGETVAVLDAKWKSDGATGRDATQIAGYTLSLDAPGALVFPETDALASDSSVVAEIHELHSVGLPTDTDATDRAEYVREIERAVREFLTAVVPELKQSS